MTTSQELSPREQVELAQYLAEATTTGSGTFMQRILASLGIAAHRFNLNQVPLDLWFEVVRTTHAGASKSAGYGRNALAVLLELVCQEFPGNDQLVNLAHSLAIVPGAEKKQGVHGLFLSHANVDMAAMEKLREQLQAMQPTLNIFPAHKSILPGDDWLNTLRDKLGQASVVIAWLTPHYLKSPFCNFEIGLAQATGARVLPVLAQPPGLPKMADLPAYLSALQHYPFTGDMPALAQHIIATLGEPA